MEMNEMSWNINETSMNINDLSKREFKKYQNFPLFQHGISMESNEMSWNINEMSMKMNEVPMEINEVPMEINELSKREFKNIPEFPLALIRNFNGNE